MNYSTLFGLNVKDVVKAVLIAVIVAFLGGLEQALRLHGFDFALYDWAGIAKLSEMAATGYIVKNFLSDESGKFLGAIG